MIPEIEPPAIGRSGRLVVLRSLSYIKTELNVESAFIPAPNKK